MKRDIVARFARSTLRRGYAAGLAGLAALMLSVGASAQTVNLADQPVFSSADVPGNLALVLSVEFPTATSVANLGNYADATAYVGYFDATKCYTYVYNSTTPSSSYFKPAAFGTGTYQHTCSGNWSGNYLNWAITPTIDPFRWALTGGYRSVDTTSQTILEKAWASGQAGTGNFPYKGTGQGAGNILSAALVSSVTPLSWGAYNSGIATYGNTMVFWGASCNNGWAPWTGSATNDQNTCYWVYARVSVCDTSTLGTAGLESNCVGYGTATTTGGVTTYSIYKPEGLMQQYSNKIRYSAFSYLNGLGTVDQGGVLREAMGFIGPTYPQPLSSTVITNSRPEWSATTGIQSTNPDTTAAGASGVAQSGVMNYLNKFGEFNQSYETYDNVSELYYAAIRYFENLGNVPEWTNAATTGNLDGFPAITTWTDPILYACQKNFILGIGDDHTWDDVNVGGAALAGSGGRAVPAAVSADTFNQATNWLAALQALEGTTRTDWWPAGAGGATQYIAGLAYGAHVLDIRPDLTGTQSISTYWMDVAEYQEVENLNPYYLAAKYGGFAVPTSPAYSIANTTPLPLSEWNTSGASITMNGGNVHPLPDNYFEANTAANMVASLKSAFANIANAIKSYTTSFSLANDNIASTGSLSFSAQFDSSNWTSVITASTLTLATNGTPSLVTSWSSSTTLQSQLAGTGWQSSGRNVATWNGTAGAAFEPATLTAAQLSALTPTSYASGTTSTMFVNYIRGDRTNEVGSTVTGSKKSLRTRTLLLGDIVDAQLTANGPPNQGFSETSNTGYAAFKTLWAARPVMVYAAANDGMVHAFVGSTGAEQFAYIPSGVITGPTSTPQVNGLVALGNPTFAHHYYADATPASFDIDFNNTYGATGSPDWHTILIGGLGKGGNSYYAIDVTNPAAMNTETVVAGKVLWEFTDSTMGYSFGNPNVMKTAKYGWVVVLTSGYNNSNGTGYVYFVNPKTGALLEKVATPSSSAGLTQAAAFIPDSTNYTADSIYVGDLNGQLWRFDVTGTSGSYPQPTLLATLTDASGNAQPISTAPLIEIHPTTRKRYVMVGTGLFLSTSDVSSSQQQTFYVIIDGTAGGFRTVATPVTRSNLTAITDLTVATTLPPASLGWYYDLGTSGGIGWRVVNNAIAYNGIVIFSALLTSGDACAPTGTSELFAVNFANAKSVLAPTTVGGPPQTDLPLGSSITNIGVISGNGNTNTELVYSDQGTCSGTLCVAPVNLKGTIATRILNWREIPTAN